MSAAIFVAIASGVFLLWLSDNPASPASWRVVAGVAGTSFALIALVQPEVSDEMQVAAAYVLGGLVCVLLRREMDRR